MSYFSVYKRNPYHWDIGGTRILPEHGTERQWRIRGEPGKIIVHDERPKVARYPMLEFKTVATAMAFIADHYMMEE